MTMLLKKLPTLLLTVFIIHVKTVNSRVHNVLHMRAETHKIPDGNGKFAATKFAFAKHFQSNMVLQREPQQANVYGFHPEIGQKIVLTVSATNASSPDYYETTVKQGPEPGVGVWMVSLKPTAAGTTVSIRVESQLGVLSLDNVIFGDVWICSGQSNMEFTVKMMKRAKEELADAHNYPNIRIFAVAENQTPSPLYDIMGVLENWSKPSEETLGGNPWTYFSAVCWMYGKYIHKALGIPIGLVDTNWGGTPVEAWSSPDALAKCGIKSDSGNLVMDKTVYYKNVQPQVKNVGLGGPSANSVLWNAMVSPLLGMTIYGVVWYQGENDQHRPMVDRYNCTFPAMIDDWRAKFHSASNGQTSSSFPFGFVQIASNVPDPSIVFGLPDIRWHQTADYGYVPNARLSNVFMAVAMDLPGFTSPYGTIHPQDKTDVGYRLSLGGLQYAYNMTEGPVRDHSLAKLAFKGTNWLLRMAMSNSWIYVTGMALIYFVHPKTPAATQAPQDGCRPAWYLTLLTLSASMPVSVLKLRRSRPSDMRGENHRVRSNSALYTELPTACLGLSL